MNISKIKSKLEKVQSAKRFEHTNAVAYTASCLAMKYLEDPDKAYIAGLLHDCAKHLSDERYLELTKKYNLGLDNVEAKFPYLLHGKVGALIAKRKFDIEDEDVLNAIRFHTTGRPKMSILEKIVFIADYIELNRKRSDSLKTIRKTAFEDLDMCILKIYEDTFNYLKDNGKKDSICPISLEAYDFYLKENLFNG